MKVRVIFRNSNDLLTSMYSVIYSSVTDAKAAIEADAKVFLDGHRYVDEVDRKLGHVSRRSAKWINTDYTDYYKAIGHDGTTCIWQYFVEQ